MNKRKVFSIIFLIVWMIFIFYMSSLSATTSASQSNKIASNLCNLFKGLNQNTVNFLVRKCAHFTEYLILGLLCLNMIKSFGLKSFLAIIICILYAISDELHQLFVIGRSCELRDVFIDSLGSVSGIIIYNLIEKRKNAKKNNRN